MSRRRGPSRRDVVDPFSQMQQEMHDSMRRMQESMASPFGSFGFGSSLFGGSHGGNDFMSQFDRMFDINEADVRQGRGNYYYESRTMTTGPDGVVREEVVRTTPGEDGRPRTRRTVREGNERDWGNAHRIRGNPEPEITVEEIDDESEDDMGTRRTGKRRARSHYGDIEVEEIQDGNAQHPDPSPSPGEWMREKYRRWRSRH